MLLDVSNFGMCLNDANVGHGFGKLDLFFL